MHSNQVRRFEINHLTTHGGYYGEASLAEFAPFNEFADYFARQKFSRYLFEPHLLVVNNIFKAVNLANTFPVINVVIELCVHVADGTLLRKINAVEGIHFLVEEHSFDLESKIEPLPYPKQKGTPLQFLEKREVRAQIFVDLLR